MPNLAPAGPIVLISRCSPSTAQYHPSSRPTRPSDLVREGSWCTMEDHSLPRLLQLWNLSRIQKWLVVSANARRSTVLTRLDLHRRASSKPNRILCFPRTQCSMGTLLLRKGCKLHPLLLAFLSTLAVSTILHLLRPVSMHPVTCMQTIRPSRRSRCHRPMRTRLPTKFNTSLWMECLPTSEAIQPTPRLLQIHTLHPHVRLLIPTTPSLRCL